MGWGAEIRTSHRSANQCDGLRCYCDGERNQADHREDSTRDMGVLPDVAQLRPISAGFRGERREKGEECCAEASQLNVLDPEVIHRVGHEPIGRVHGQEQNECRERPPKTRARVRGEREQDEERYDAADLRDSTDRETRVIDRLNLEIRLLTEPHFARQLESMGESKGHCHGNEDDGRNLQKPEHGIVPRNCEPPVIHDRQTGVVGRIYTMYMYGVYIMQGRSCGAKSQVWQRGKSAARRAHGNGVAAGIA